VALVTGAARGIGREIARACARAGADVVALDIADDIAGHPVPLATQADLAERSGSSRPRGVAS
jgi:NAD(P)-dependent dehydrogenase (short-subunit alcohol dehydrogenase family)